MLEVSIEISPRVVPGVSRIMNVFVGPVIRHVDLPTWTDIGERIEQMA